MRDTIVVNLRARLDAYNERVTNIDEDVLTAKLDVAKHKSLDEPEVMHEGQIIRHVYGTGGTVASREARSSSGRMTLISCNI